MNVRTFPFDVADEFSLMLPIGGTILHVGQDPAGQTCMWVLGDPAGDTMQRRFRVFATGQEIRYPDLLRHVATFVMPPVWHLFEIVR